MSSRIPDHAWVAVCDGAKGIVFRNDGELGSPNLRTVVAMNAEHRPAHEHGSDRPDRLSTPAGSGRHAVEVADRHRSAEIQFLEDFTSTLDKVVPLHDLRGALIVVAPPQALGIVRRKLSPRLLRMLKKEIARDVVGFPVDQIEALLSISD